MKASRRALVLVALLAGLWLALRPFGDFPLDDDWVYFLEVKNFLSTGAARVLDISSPSLVSHLWWGALFARLFGPSHVVLRASTLALAALSVWVLERAASRKNESLPFTASPGLWLLACPLFFVLSLTFMSDVPFLAWSLFAWACWTRPGSRSRLAGSAFAALAVLGRQIGLALPFAALWVFRRGLSWRAALELAGLPLLAAAGHHWWFVHAHGPTWASETYVSGELARRLSSPLAALSQLYGRVAAGLLYLGLFTLPAALSCRRRRLGGAAVALLAFLAPLLAYRGLLPYFTGVIGRFGLGVLAISGRDAKAAGVLGPPWGPALLTAAGLWSLAVWSTRLPELRRAAREPDARLLALGGALAALAMALGPRYFDRYYLPAVPGALLLASRSCEGAAGRARAVAASLLLLWSFAGSWDYLAWNAAKRRLAERAVAAGLKREEILGGLDWNGLYSYEPAMAALKARKPLREIGEWEWLELDRMKAFETFSPEPAPGFVVADRERYWTPLTLGRGAVYLHERAP